MPGEVPPGPQVPAGEPTLRPLALKCEYAENPLGIETARPRLSWRVESPLRRQMQGAYQLLVASGPDKLAEGAADLWDSGRVASDRSVQIEYQGQGLKSFDRCYWKVRVWNQSGTASPYSEAATWEMGLLQPADWRAHWITADYLLKRSRLPREQPPSLVLPSVTARRCSERHFVCAARCCGRVRIAADWVTANCT